MTIKVTREWCLVNKNIIVEFALQNKRTFNVIFDILRVIAFIYSCVTRVFIYIGYLIHSDIYLQL